MAGIDILEKAMIVAIIAIQSRMMITNPATGDYGVVDCSFDPEPLYDYPLFEPSAAGVCGATGDDPCNPKGGSESSWGQIKSMFR